MKCSYMTTDKLKIRWKICLKVHTTWRMLDRQQINDYNITDKLHKIDFKFCKVCHKCRIRLQ